MSILKITRAARDAIITRLSQGFTPLLVAAANDAGLSIPDQWVLPIDFSIGSTNFFRANITPELLDQNEVMTIPFMTVYSRNSRNANYEKFQTFSGPIVLGINLFTSWDASDPYTDIETWGDVYEEALFGAFNAPTNASWAQIADDRLVYNGDLQIDRGPIMRGGESVLQVHYGMLGLDVHAL